MVFRKKYLLAVRYLLIELLLDRANYFNLSFDCLFLSKFLRWAAAILHFLVMRKRNCHVNTGI